MQEVAGFLSQHAGTATPVPQRYTDAFIELFGTTDFPAAPGVPLNATHSLLQEQPGSDDPFAVWLLSYELPGRERERAAACDEHGAGVLRSLVAP